jgi:hypothetical protein
MLAFAMVAHGDMVATSSIDAGNLNVAAYATRDAQGTCFLTVINKEPKRDISINCSAPGGTTVVEAYRLSAPDLGATSNVTFAGSAVAADGTWLPLPAEPVPTTVGDAHCTVPHASAIVLKFRRD